ncbi:hypothetical protein MJO28_013512 [Puccinia striiformis f. sp. tritici]|uniref:Uncharacterized protein n=1 Tax=Puccinia striiformis f. sp. tritici TaxID=168172 RepID=A0ACC0DVR4_9BASI|nr:hypothetical protein MJO28_013512 [Puccinia striiformis f. sp. tritici]
MTSDNPNSLGSRAHQRMSRINRRISVLPIPTVSNFSKRIHGMTWQAYPVGLGTATGYILLANLKTHPAFLTKIEILLFIMNIIIFSLTTGLMVVQAIQKGSPRSKQELFYTNLRSRFCYDNRGNCQLRELLHPISLLTQRSCSQALMVFNTGVPAGVTVEELIIFFWIYVTFAISVAITVLTIWFSSPRNPTAAMTPAWAFPVFPLLLTGVVTFNVLRIVPLTDPRAVSIFVTGFLMFGAGAFMCIFYLAIFLLRIMTTGFLDGHQANGAFIAAGPPVRASFYVIYVYITFSLRPADLTLNGSLPSHHTSLCRYTHRGFRPLYSSTWVKSRQNCKTTSLGQSNLNFSSGNANQLLILVWQFPNPFADITQRWRDLFSGCVMVGIMLTGCSALLFTMAAIPYWTRLHKHLNEILGCWATTFPNIGLILSLKFLGDTFDSKVFYTFQTILTVMVFVVYLIVLFLTILAIWKGLILMSDDKSVYMDNIGLSEEKTDIEKGGHGSAHAPAHKH